MFIGRTDVEAETLLLWPLDVKSWLIGKDPGARKNWRQEKKEAAEDEMVGWHHQLNGHGFGWTPGVGGGQGGLVCCSSWGRKESDTSEQLNWTNTLLITRDGGDGLVIKSCLTVVTPWNVPSQAPLLIGFPRQEYWSELPFSSPGDRHKQNTATMEELKIWWGKQTSKQMIILLINLFLQ